jgi:hypothetical protein
MFAWVPVFGLQMKRQTSIAIAIFLMAFSRGAAAAPKAELWPMWAQSDESNTAEIDHSAWQGLLDRYLDTHSGDGIYLVRYGAVSATDRQTLDTYINDLQASDPRDYSKAEQKAYWINLYNAATVQLVLNHPTKKSILRMGDGFFKIGPWNEPLLTVAGEEVTLNDIEHRILRPIWQDHRIHFGVNCASLSCPNLVEQAYTGGNTDTLLDQNERAYINHPRGVSFDDKGGLMVSRIFKWYGDDFAKNQQQLLEYFASHADEPLASQLRAYDGRLSYDYDWALNGT